MSYFFDGTDGVSLTTGTSQLVINYPFSIFAWIYPLRTTAIETVVGLQSSSTSDFWRVTLEGTTTDQVTAVSFKGGAGQQVATTTTTYVANKWQLVGARYDSNTSRVAYLDTDSASNSVDSTQTGAASIDRIYVGTDASGGRRFQGYIANVAVRYGYATTFPNFNAEVDLLADGASQLAVRPQNVVLHWSLTSPGVQLNESPHGPKLIFPVRGTSGFSHNNPYVERFTPLQRKYFLARPNITNKLRSQIAFLKPYTGILPIANG